MAKKAPPPVVITGPKWMEKHRPKIELILQGLRDTGNLRASCVEHGVGHSTFLNWVSIDPVLADQYAKARELGLEIIAQEIVDISDDGSRDQYEDKDGNLVTNHELVARSRLKVDSRKWLLAKLMPHKYGDKIQVDGKVAHTVVRFIDPPADD